MRVFAHFHRATAATLTLAATLVAGLIGLVDPGKLRAQPTETVQPAHPIPPSSALSSSRVVWFFGVHEDNSHFYDRVLQILEGMVAQAEQKAGVRIVYSRELAPPDLATLRITGPWVLPQDFLRRLEGEEGLRRLKEPAVQKGLWFFLHWWRSCQRSGFARYRRFPQMALSLGREKEVLQFLHRHPEVELLLEDPGLDSFTKRLESDLAFEAAWGALYESKRIDRRKVADLTTRAFRAVAEGQRLRDEKLIEEESAFLKKRLETDPIILHLITRGIFHQGMEDQVAYPASVQVAVEIQPPPDRRTSSVFSNLVRSFDKDGPREPSPSAQRAIPRFFPWAALLKGRRPHLTSEQINIQLWKRLNGLPDEVVWKLNERIGQGLKRLPGRVGRVAGKEFKKVLGRR